MYVAQNLSEEDVNPAYIIPKDFMDLKTDVIEPLSYGSSTNAVDYIINHYISDDMSNVDWSRLHQLHLPNRRYSWKYCWHSRILC